MIYMNSRFDDKSQNVIRLAGEIASEMGYNYVGSEHILAAIAKEAADASAPPIFPHPKKPNVYLLIVSIPFLFYRICPFPRITYL